MVNKICIYNGRGISFYVDSVIDTSCSSYELQELIGKGGNGVVWKCASQDTGDELAIKFNLATNVQGAARFQQEVGLMKRLSHGQLVSCIDDGSAPALFCRGKNWRKNITIDFAAMPLASGSLAQHLRGVSRRVPYADYSGQFIGLAQALSELHTVAVHRDIKPENILIIGESWCLSDFGICKLHYGGQDLTLITDQLGPRFWMSPEAMNRLYGNSDVITKSSDVFQLASVFWLVVTGRHPTGIISRNDWNGSSELFDIVYSALSHEPAKRPKDGPEFLSLVKSAIYL
jgi:serine/threonine-protein kinase